MWSVVLKILSILGIILLVLLGTVLTAALLVLFVPVVYRGSGSAHAGEYQVCLRFRWLFGLVRGKFTYPEDGTLRIKALWLTLYDSGGKGRDTGPAEEEKQASKPVTENGTEAAAADAEGAADAPEVSQIAEGAAAEAAPDKAGEADGAEVSQKAAEPAQNRTEEQDQKPERLEGLCAKLSALKKKLHPYLEIVRDEDNQMLVRHLLGRLSRILKSIRPRILRLEALIGLGEPDTTGYVYGVCWAIKPFLGRKCRIAITPDFERQILEGEIFLRGHIMGVVLLHNIIRAILDKRLWQLVDRLKKIQE